jgi:predicted nucleic acid-binding protein
MNLEALIALPRTRMVNEREDFLAAYREVTGNFPIRGNLVPDAHLATILWQHEVRILYTNGRDFLKFDFLEIRNPLV